MTNSLIVDQSSWTLANRTSAPVLKVSTNRAPLIANATDPVACGHYILTSMKVVIVSLVGVVGTVVVTTSVGPVGEVVPLIAIDC